MEARLPLTEREHLLAKMFRRKYGFKWPLCAHLAKDVCETLVREERDLEHEDRPDDDEHQSEVRPAGHG